MAIDTAIVAGTAPARLTAAQGIVLRRRARACSFRGATPPSYCRRGPMFTRSDLRRCLSAGEFAAETNRAYSGIWSSSRPSHLRGPYVHAAQQPRVLQIRSLPSGQTRRLSPLQTGEGEERGHVHLL